MEVSNDWHLFLLAYRGALRETHAVCEAAAKIQAAYRARVDAGLDPGDQPSPAGMFAVERMVVAWETHCYKETLDEAFLRRDPSVLEHDVIELGVARPSVAASALFSLDGVEKAGQTLMVTLTILPLGSSRTVAVFSYLTSHAEVARLRLAHVLRATGAHRMYEISRQLLNSCENFVLSPSFVDGWSTEKKDTVLNYWVRTLMKDDLDTQDRDLMLFATPHRRCGRHRHLTVGCRLRSLTLTSVNHGPERAGVPEQ